MREWDAIDTAKLDSTHRDECLDIIRSLPEWFSYPGALDDIGASLESDRGFVASRGGAIGGFITLAPAFAETIEVRYLAVHATRRRGGFGRALVHAAARFADERGVGHLSLLTLGPSGESPFYDETVRFYVSLGFARAKELHITEWGGAPALVLCAPVGSLT